MKKLLLDTHIFLWYANGDPRLPEGYAALISDLHNQVFVSVISVWEMTIKIARRKLKLEHPITTYIDELNTTIMPVELAHVLELQKLPLIHRDPFDRMLVAQARVEEAHLLTLDGKIMQYLETDGFQMRSPDVVYESW